MHTGIFIGATTIDLIYELTQFPESDSKNIAEELRIHAGGPPLNASVIFTELGNKAELITAIGEHPSCDLIKSELKEEAISYIDLAKGIEDKPTIATILTTKNNGDRTVVTKRPIQREYPKPIQLKERVDSASILLVDGNFNSLTQSFVDEFSKQKKPIVIDGGSYKNDNDQFLANITDAICSEKFRAPNCKTLEETKRYLIDLGIPRIAFTHGGEAIQYIEMGIEDSIQPPQINAIDTLGAGDFFHGAYCHYFLQTKNFALSLKKASKIAALSCMHPGTRRWLKHLPS